MYGQLDDVELAGGGKRPAFSVAIPHPRKLACLRLPTELEMNAYLGSRATRFISLGRQRTKREDIPNPAADRKLFDAVRFWSDPPDGDWDDAEVLKAITDLTAHRISDCQRDGETYIITLDTIWGQTVHTLSMPLQRDLLEWRRAAASVTDFPRGIRVLRYPPEPGNRFYDKCFISATGYYSAKPLEPTDPAVKALVPPHHKDSIVGELVTAIGELDPSLDPNS